MTDKQLCRAFVSSTYIDLKEHRTRVIDTLRKSGIHVDPMEDWSADDREPKAFSAERVNGCRLCILLVAFRRGHVPEGETLSVTQMEYNHAITNGLKMLPFLLGDDEPWPRRYDEMQKDPGIRQWRDDLRQKHGIGTFGIRPDSLDVAPAVLRWFQQPDANAPREHVSRLLQARADRNLLYGMLALEMDFINENALLGAQRAWMRDKAKPLGQILRELGELTDDVDTALEALVRKHLSRHGQDVRKSLSAVQPNASISADLASLADPEIQQSVVSLQSQSGSHSDSNLIAQQRSVNFAAASLRYRILGPHKRGGLGEVFVAHDEELGRKVALKQIRAEYADHPTSRAQFLLEAEITGGLEHPSIVPVYGLCAYADGRPFYAMRFIHGESLRQAIQSFHKAESPSRDPGERALALRSLLNSFVAVCNAIAYAHSRGVLHRDLKPANVMLGPYGETLVVDWGLAKLMAADSPPEPGQELLEPTSANGPVPAQLDSGVGTPEYMAPEQALGRSDRVGPRTDVYGLGAVLFEILTGRPPHDREWRTPDPPRAQAVQPSAPEALDEIAAKAMAADPADRYSVASRLAEAVQRWLAEEPVSTYRALVARLRGLADSHPEILDYREELARNCVNLGLVLSGMARHLDAAESFHSAVAEYESVAQIRPTVARYRADLATARLHLSQALAALHRNDEADLARKAAVADYDWLMATNPNDYQTNLASVIITLMPQVRAHPQQAAPEAPSPDSDVNAIPSSMPFSTEGEGEASRGVVGNTTIQRVPELPASVAGQPAEIRARFTRVRMLAQGGSARIWIAIDNDLNREVALKEILEIHFDNPAAHQRFLREAQIMAQLEHPNIVPVHGLGRRSQNESPFLIMRYVRGRDLRQAVREYYSGSTSPQELRALLRAFVDACHAMAYAHSRGVLHRDPKPANILLADNGEAFVVDWGLAKVHDVSIALQEEGAKNVSLTGLIDLEDTQEGVIMGTPGYMAPEMASGNLDLVDARTDVYVLGAGLFEILTGQPPFQRRDVMTTLAAVINDDRPRARSLNPSVPAALDAICARAMAMRREDRYVTASELGQDVQNWLDGEPVSAFAESRIHRWGRLLSRPWRLTPKIEK